MAVTSSDPPSFKTPPHPLYASITSVNLSPTAKLVTVAGQIGEDPLTGETPENLSEQVDVCLRRLDACLEHGGATKKDITRFMYYITQRGIDEMEAKEGPGSALKLVGGKVGGWMEGHRPAACFLRVFGMSNDKFLCEFECMAVVTE